MITRSPGANSRTSGPTASTTPTASWPMTTPGWAGNLPTSTLRSVPQIPVWTTRTTTSVGLATVGLGRSARASVRSLVSTSAFMAGPPRFGVSAPLDRVDQRRVQFRCAGRDAGLLVLGRQVEQFGAAEIRAERVGDVQSGQPGQVGRGRDVVREQVQDRTAAGAAEFRLGVRMVLQDPVADVDVGVQLPGDDP